MCLKISFLVLSLVVLVVLMVLVDPVLELLVFWGLLV